MHINYQCYIIIQDRICIINTMKKGHNNMAIVEKAQETSLDIYCYAQTEPLLYYMNSGRVLECKDTPTSHVHCVTTR